MAEKFLNGTDVVTPFQQVDGTRVTEGVACGRLGGPGRADRVLDAVRPELTSGSSSHVRRLPESRWHSAPTIAPAGPRPPHASLTPRRPP
jgi:hypothetical protein